MRPRDYVVGVHGIINTNVESVNRKGWFYLKRRGRKYGVFPILDGISKAPVRGYDRGRKYCGLLLSSAVKPKVERTCRRK
ncbi:MAG: hypothetical protein DRP46_04055 [Candidatus Zixiibacteriota bacterium]|nr:MAG: hypothetical protein DRP46_04055 [candidate division Zixibacteria bacterium]